MYSCSSHISCKYLDFYYIKIAVVFYLLLSSIGSPLHAQTKLIDSLKEVLAILKDSENVDCLNNLAYAYTLNEKKDSALHYTGLAYSEAIKINYIHGVAVSLVRKARIVKHFDDDLVQAEKFSKESLNWFEKTSNKEGLYDVYHELMYSIFGQSRFDEAIGYAQKKYDWSKKAGDGAKMFDALSNIAAIYKDAGNYERSLYYNQQARQLAIKIENRPALQSILFGLGEMFMKIEDYPSALANFREAFQMDTPEFEKLRQDGDFDIWVKMEYAEIFCHLNLFDLAWHYFELYKPSGKNDRYYRVYLVSVGEYYFLQKKYDTALQKFLPGLYFHKKLNNRNEIQRTLIFVAKTYLALHQYDSAMKYGWEALAVANTTKAKQITRDACEVLYKIYDWRKQPDSAYIYFRNFVLMGDSVANEQTKAKFVVFNYDQKIELLDKEKQLQQQQLKQNDQQKKILIGGIAVIILLGIILFRNILLKRKNEAHRRDNIESELQLQKLESEKIKAQLQQQATELEMQALRAQMNPHFIFNSLNAINSFILQNNKQQASEYLTKFSRLVRLILQNSQSGLITPESELESLKLYLELEALRFDNHFNFAIDVNKELDTLAIKVPPLIIQPYVENAIWHGLMHKNENGRLQIELYEEANMLYCKITDDGIGRKKSAELKSKSAASHKSMGMQITANRIAMLQQNEYAQTQIKINDLVLPDGSAGGTEVILKIPVCYG